jgi:hypothetical protein
MDKLASVAQQLQQERAHIDAALQALTGAVSNNRGTCGTARTGGRTLSAARKRIAAAQRTRCASGKLPKMR